MRRRTFLALALSVAGVSLLAGCGGGDSSMNPAGRGAAEGFLFTGADGTLRLFNTAAEGTAAGLQPASGVRTQIVSGGGSATIGPDGRLQIQGIEAGHRTLRLTAQSGATTDIPLTVVPDAVLPLGETPVKRQQAVDALQAFAVTQGVPDVFTNADVLLSSTPMPAGVAISPSLPAGEEALSIESPSWVIYVDREPGARFGHPTLIVLVDAATGKLTGVDSLSWPKLNDFHLYEDRTANATSPDALRVAPRRGVSRIVEAPLSVESPFGTVASRLAATCRSKDPDTSRTHALLVQGSGRPDFAADIEPIANLLSVGPFPQIGTMRKISTFDKRPEPGRPVFLREFAAVRDACKSGDTFVLYITAHGMIHRDYQWRSPGDNSRDEPVKGLVFKPKTTPTLEPTEDEVAATYHTLLGTWDGSDTLEPDGLDFTECKACRIILWIDTCYSGNWITLLRRQLESLPDKDILILTSANHRTQSQGSEVQTNTVDINGETIYVPVGGVFSQSLRLGVHRLQSTNPPETGADILADAFPFASLVTNSLDLEFGVLLQNPRLWRRPLEPDAVCGRGNQEVTIK